MNLRTGYIYDYNDFILNPKNKTLKGLYLGKDWNIFKDATYIYNNRLYFYNAYSKDRGIVINLDQSSWHFVGNYMGGD